MNTATGEIYGLSETLHAKLREPMTTRVARELIDDKLIVKLKDDIKALEAIERGESVVPVSETVVQKVALGERELNRRQRRRARRN